MNFLWLTLLLANPQQELKPQDKPIPKFEGLMYRDLQSFSPEALEALFEKRWQALLKLYKFINTNGTVQGVARTERYFSVYGDFFPYFASQHSIFNSLIATKSPKLLEAGLSKDDLDYLHYIVTEAQKEAPSWIENRDEYYANIKREHKAQNLNLQYLEQLRIGETKVYFKKNFDLMVEALSAVDEMARRKILIAMDRSANGSITNYTFYVTEFYVKSTQKLLSKGEEQ